MYQTLRNLLVQNFKRRPPPTTLSPPPSNITRIPSILVLINKTQPYQHFRQRCLHLLPIRKMQSLQQQNLEPRLKFPLPETTLGLPCRHVIRHRPQPPHYLSHGLSPPLRPISHVEPTHVLYSLV